MTSAGQSSRAHVLVSRDIDARETSAVALKRLLIRIVSVANSFGQVLSTMERGAYEIVGKI